MDRGAGAADGGVPASPLPELLLGFCPYTVLGISPPEEKSARLPSGSATAATPVAVSASAAFFASVTLKTLASSYRRAALRAHPDKNRGRETQAAEEFVRIQAAYSFLSCEKNRAAYHAFLESRERHEALLADRRRRGLQADEKKRKFAEDLKRREEAFAQSQRDAKEAERGARARADFEKDRLQRVRERNEKILEEHQEKLNARHAQQTQAAREASAAFFHQKPRFAGGGQPWDVFDFKRRKVQESHADFDAQRPISAPARNGEAEDADDIEDILTRSVYVHWAVEAPGADGETRAEKSGSSSNPGSPENEQGEAPSAAVTPTLLSALFIPLHALYIYGYTAEKGYALVAFATRERALESALEFQQQQKQTRRGLGSGKKKPPRLRVKIADQVEHLKERLSALQEDADVAGAEFARVAADAAKKRADGETPSANSRGFADPAQEATQAPDLRSAPTMSARGTPEPAQAPPFFPSPPAVMTPTSLAEFEAATLQQLRLAAAKRKALQAAQQQDANGAGPPPGVGG
ncbi:putative DnaJ domain-containing protein [Neospora caninum Liverpool]|uniref:DnaJ domain-containing protein, putative n=1 Tax=Neospora caninum (strain Liverpool) TaxID=572307 RepID=F0VJ31_NEOCL|nr:putative DnaJ domain-containing protein [Neospora caninum Liverpool]CBZ53742.1 putative DnaJ domain-containing protein [Neospora caninum Liverpool]CEL67733.1 TPA: DnaJ domain-containing protein, putative [Neospora caninum Liverpool]|eukprot:XP_003883774.1 putative DnaJ domain-containing protein [Neospora caninum Liverpool]